MTYKLSWPESDHAIYLTINHVVDDQGRLHPVEVFLNSKEMAYYAWAATCTRLISAVLRQGITPQLVIDELKEVFDPQGGHFVPDPRDPQKSLYCHSVQALIGLTLERHFSVLEEDALARVDSQQRLF